MSEAPALRADAATLPRLLDGPPLTRGAESIVSHRARLGDVPVISGQRREAMLARLDQAGLLGRGGAGFPAARKWRAVAQRAHGRAIIVANVAEGEPAAAKDRLLAETRPHLILDGMVIAAHTVGARSGVVYLPRAYSRARTALAAALDERGRDGVHLSIVVGPHRYVAGEETAVVAFLNGRESRPTQVPPRPFERGVRNRPTLVHNAETLAHTALIARFGAEWFRAAGTESMPGTLLVTLSGAVATPGVREVAGGSLIRDVIDDAGGITDDVAGVLVGGYFGRLLTPQEAWDLPLDDRLMKQHIGCGTGAGVVAVIPQSACLVAETSRMLGFLARESAGQCGPCLFGLGAIATTFEQMRRGSRDPRAIDRLRRWAGEVAGRGACKHPDGAALLLGSFLERFGAQLTAHQRNPRCAGCDAPAVLPVPLMDEGWR